MWISYFLFKKYLYAELRSEEIILKKCSEEKIHPKNNFFWGLCGFFKKKRFSV
jgi:hypothetical protein